MNDPGMVEFFYGPSEATLTRRLHIRFICKLCKRRTGGCPKTCVGPHRVEEVGACAICSKDKHEPYPEVVGGGR